MSSVYIGLGFSSNLRMFARPKKLIYSIEPDFPCLADKIAEPCPNMNDKVAAFTVSKKSYNNSSASPKMSNLIFNKNESQKLLQS